MDHSLFHLNPCFSDSLGSYHFTLSYIRIKLFQFCLQFSLLKVQLVKWYTCMWTYFTYVSMYGKVLLGNLPEVTRGEKRRAKNVPDLKISWDVISHRKSSQLEKISLLRDSLLANLLLNLGFPRIQLSVITVTEFPVATLRNRGRCV